MKKKLLKIALSSTSAGLLLGGATLIPLVSCSANTIKNISVNQFPQSFNISREEFNKICNLINAGPNFENKDYINANKFVLNSIRNTLDNNQKDLININSINEKNYVINIDNANNNQYLYITTISNKKKYTFSFNRQHGDIFYGGNNNASISTVGQNQWANLLSFNNSQYTQSFLNNIYQQLGLSITINNGALSPWLTNGFYDGVNSQTIFTVYGYYENQPFSYNSAIPVCNIAIKTKSKFSSQADVEIISKINPNVSSIEVKNLIGKDLGKIWNKDNDLIKLVNILNIFTATNMNATGGLIGGDQQIITGLETNISKLLQAIGNTNPLVKTNVENLLSTLKINPQNVDFQQVNSILSQLIEICKNPKTYSIYNNIVTSLNQILGQNNYNQYINLNTLNQTFEDAILGKNLNVIDSNFNGLIDLFNGFDFGTKDVDLQEKLWKTFIEHEFKGWAIRFASNVANDWLMISSPSNIYLDADISSWKDTNNIKGSLYLKIVNNTNTPKMLNFMGQTINVPMNQAFNFYLEIDKNNLVPFVYADNGQFKFGLKIKSNNGTQINSYYRYGVFDKNATGIESNNNFTKVPLNQDFNMNGMVACGGNITNIKLNEIKKDETPKVNPTTTTTTDQQIGDALKNLFTTNFQNAVNTMENLSIITKAFSNENNTVLQALNDAAPGINKVLVSLIQSIANFGQGTGSSITSLISIINSIQPNGNVPEIVKTLNGILPILNKIINYVPHLYKTLNNGTTVDMIGTFVNGEYEGPNTKTIIEMFGNLIQGLLTSYQPNKITDPLGKTTTSDGQTPPQQSQTPYALWDLLNDHIDDLVGILVSITPIMNMIPNEITSNPVTDSDQWQPTYSNNKTSSLDSIIPVITSNFFNASTGAPISKEEMKNIIAGLDSIAPTIEGLLSNGGAIPPTTLSLITNLIKSLAATAAPTPEGKPDNAQSLLTFISKNGQVIVDILNGVNSKVGKIVGAILTAFTGIPNASDFLNVTIGHLNGHDNTQPSQPNTPVVNSNTIGVKVVKTFWDRLFENLSTINPSLANIANIMKIVGPLFGGLLNATATPKDENGNLIDLKQLKNVLNLTFINDNNKNQLKITFNQNINFDLTSVINGLPTNIGTIVKKFLTPNFNSTGYAIKLNQNTPIVYDLIGYNPSFSNNKNEYLVNGISAHLNYSSTNIKSILGFINFTTLNKTIKFFKKFISSFPIPNILKTILNYALLDDTGDHFMYLLFNILLPHFGSIINLNLGSSNINNDLNEIDPYNYVLINEKLTNINLPSLTPESFKIALSNSTAFGKSFWTNIDNKKAFLNSKNNNESQQSTTSFIYTSLVPLIAIDNKGNRREIKQIEFTLSGSNSSYSISMKPIYKDSVFTTLVRNFVSTLLSADVISTSTPSTGTTIPTVEPTINSKISLTNYGNKLVDFLDNQINSPITSALLSDLGGWKSKLNIKLSNSSTDYLDQISSSNTVSLANLEPVLKTINWTSSSTNTNLEILKKIASNSTYNKLISVTITELKNNGIPKTNKQTITLNIPNSILNSQASTKAKATTTLTFNISWTNGTNPTTLKQVGTSIPFNDEAKNYAIINPITTTTTFLNTLYNIAINPDGIAFEKQMGDIASGIISVINSFMGYYPPINKIASVLSNNTIINLVNQFFPLIIKNANNDNWWANVVQPFVGMILKIIGSQKQISN